MNKPKNTKDGLNKQSSKQIKLEQKALKLIGQGELDEAEKIYRQLILNGTNNYIVYCNLAVLCGKRRTNNQEERISLLNKALKLNPKNPETYNNLGNALKAKGDFNKAISSFEEAIRLNSNYLDAYLNLGITLYQVGNFNTSIKSLKNALKLNTQNPKIYYFLGRSQQHINELNAAVVSYKEALKINPRYKEAYYNLGNSLRKIGNFKEANSAYENALKLYQDYSDIYSYNIGNNFQKLGNTENAITAYKYALKLNPNYHEAYNNLGIAYKAQGDSMSAISSYKAAIKIQPKFVEAYNNLGNCQLELSDLKAAIESFNYAIKLNPKYAAAHYNLGVAYQKKDNLNIASRSFNYAIKLNPKYSEAYNNLGIIFQELGEFDAAIESFNDAIKINPKFFDVYFNLSQIQLLLGDYQSGWKNYAYRWLVTKPSNLHGKSNLNLWQGEHLAKGEKLLVISEQGLGDTIQFMRYIPYLRAKGIDICFSAKQKLHSLIKKSRIDLNPLTPEQTKEVTSGKWIPLLSLPKHLKITSNNPLVSNPYIFTSNELINKWKNILQSKKPLIGINWQGDPNTEKSYRGRSIPLETFSPIFNNNQIEILSLQKGWGSEQIKACSFKEKFIDCQSQIDMTWDFSENAAIIANCDLIITCDTSIAHLAGGMGVKVWLLLKNIPYWTWGMKIDNTFWYPSMRLFRQTKRHDWAEVMDEVAIELDELF